MNAAVKAAKKEGAAAGRKQAVSPLQQLHADAPRRTHAQGECMLWACDVPLALSPPPPLVQPWVNSCSCGGYDNCASRGYAGGGVAVRGGGEETGAIADQ